MEKSIKLLPWVLFVGAASLIVVIASNQDIGMEKLIEWGRSPILIALVVSSFVFLTVDRIKDMTGRIGKIEERTSGFWNEAIKEIQTVASNHAKATVQELIKEVEDRTNDVNGEVQKTLDDNPWLSSINPNELVLYTKNLQPVQRKASKMLRADKSGENTEIVRKWVMDLIKDPEIRGTANDYHNLGVLASRDLDDKLLSIEICEAYLGGHTEPNADVLSDMLQDLTDCEEYKRAGEIADQLLPELTGCNPLFVRRWRPWAFLSEYYRAVGEHAKALDVLEEAKKHVVDTDGAPHILSSLASCHEGSGNIDAATSQLVECLDKYPAYTPATLGLANRHIGKGELEAAKSVVENGLKFRGYNPHFDLHYNRLDSIHMKLVQNENPGDDPKDTLLTAANIVLGVAKEEIPNEAFEKLAQKVIAYLQQLNEEGEQPD
jgi:tetratricopeptide (TPR) repeat protein